MSSGTDSGDPNRSLTPAAQSGARWQFIAQAVETALATGCIIVLARLVRPADYGLVALLAAIAGAMTTLVASPIGSAIVVRKLTDPSGSATAWWMAVGISSLFSVGLALLAVVFGWSGKLYAAALVIAGSVPIQAAAIVTIGILQQRLAFRRLAIARVIAAAVGNGAALAIAAEGSGFAGLLARAACVPLMQFATCSAAAGWRPCLTFSRRQARAIALFVRGITGFGAINQVMRRGDDVIIGSVLGSSALGYYSLSYRFVELPVSQVGQAASNVSLPVLSRIEDPDRFRTAFLRAQKVLVWAVAPVGICSMFLGDIAVPAVLGERWASAGPIVQVFGAVGLLQAATSQVGSIYLAREATGLFFRWAAYVAPVFLASVLIGLSWGALGVAWSYLAFNILIFYPEWAMPGRLIGLTPLMVVSSLVAELGLALVVAGAGALVRLAVTIEGIGALAIAATAASGLYWAGVLLLDSTLRRDVLGIAGQRWAVGPFAPVALRPKAKQ